ncbi:hypothetical protein [Halorubrum sp. HHNYT27]|uniref:hypothetical protein n=1 Tax=Halorubrum sp. HHNYT27 TaxID=3402275 RepID=UPI003EBE4B39
MKAGVVGIVDGTFNVVDSFTDTVSQDGHDLERCLTIDRVFSLPGGDMAFAGRAAATTLRDRSTTTIENGAIHVTEEAHPETHHTEFVGVAGEFVAVGSGEGTFAFDLIAEDTGTDVERATLNLDAFFASHESATPWKAGFHGTGEDGVNGIFHGKNLRTDLDLEDVLRDSTLNQVGLSYRYNGNDVKMTASKSGYVEVYRPNGYDSANYLEYLRDEIVQHVS